MKCLKDIDKDIDHKYIEKNKEYIPEEVSNK